MAAPNIINVTTITGKTALFGLVTGTANIITNSTGSNSVYKINDIVISNYTAITCTANVMINRSDTSFYLAGNIAIPAYSTLVVLAKDTTLYLEEGDVLQANISNVSSTHMVASYEIIG